MMYYPPPLLHGTTTLNGPGYPHCLGFTVALGRTPLGEESARCRDLYPTSTQHSQEREIHTPWEFELAIPASERPQATGIGMIYCMNFYATCLYISNNNYKSLCLLLGICIILKLMYSRIESVSVQCT